VSLLQFCFLTRFGVYTGPSRVQSHCLDEQGSHFLSATKSGARIWQVPTEDYVLEFSRWRRISGLLFCGAYQKFISPAEKKRDNSLSNANFVTRVVSTHHFIVVRAASPGFDLLDEVILIVKGQVA